MNPSSDEICQLNVTTRIDDQGRTSGAPEREVANTKLPELVTSDLLLDHCLLPRNYRVEAGIVGNDSEVGEAGFSSHPAVLFR